MHFLKTIFEKANANQILDVKNKMYTVYNAVR